MTLSAGNCVDRDIVAAKSWNWMHLFALTKSLTKTKLTAFVVSPGEHFSELSFFILWDNHLRYGSPRIFSLLIAPFVSRSD